MAYRDMIPRIAPEPRLDETIINWTCACHTPFPGLTLPNLHRITTILTKTPFNPDPGFVHVIGLTRDGNYDPNEIFMSLKSFDRFVLIQLLDSLKLLDELLYHLSKKVFTNTATQDEFMEYVQRLNQNEYLKNWYFNPYQNPQDYGWA